VVPSQHRRKLRCLELCPVNDQLIATRYDSQNVLIINGLSSLLKLHKFDTCLLVMQCVGRIN
jgi:hypothetical protein